MTNKTILQTRSFVSFTELYPLHYSNRRNKEKLLIDSCSFPIFDICTRVLVVGENINKFFNSFVSGIKIPKMLCELNDVMNKNTYC